MLDIPENSTKPSGNNWIKDDGLGYKLELFSNEFQWRKGLRGSLGTKEGPSEDESLAMILPTHSRDLFLSSSDISLPLGRVGLNNQHPYSFHVRVRLPIHV